VGRLGSLLQTEIANYRREQEQVTTLERQVGELTGQLAEKVAAQQRWQQSKAELEHDLGRHRAQLTEAATAATNQELELKRLRLANEELHIIQSALCARVRELTTQNDVVSRRILELDGQSEAVARTVASRDQELAALRYACLAAARFGANVSRERLQTEGQVVDGWKRLLNTLHQTPLSLMQRGVVSEITGALETWRNGRTTSGAEFQVELPDLHESEFDGVAVIENALAVVQKNAGESGAKVQTAILGSVPERVRGNAQHIHQLITLLADSLAAVAAVENVELQVSFAPSETEAPQLLLALVLTSNCSPETLCLHLAAQTDSSAALSSGRRDPAELTLAAAWQLAFALGGCPRLETTVDHKVQVQVALPLQVASLPEASHETAPLPIEIHGDSGASPNSSRSDLVGVVAGQPA
jgi:hypothetical protein